MMNHDGDTKYIDCCKPVSNLTNRDVFISKQTDMHIASVIDILTSVNHNCKDFCPLHTTDRCPYHKRDKFSDVSSADCIRELTQWLGEEVDD